MLATGADDSGGTGTGRTMNAHTANLLVLFGTGPGTSINYVVTLDDREHAVVEFPSLLADVLIEAEQAWVHCRIDNPASRGGEFSVALHDAFPCTENPMVFGASWFAVIDLVHLRVILHAPGQSGDDHTWDLSFDAFTQEHA
jgi:hypothetical protein